MKKMATLLVLVALVFTPSLFAEEGMMHGDHAHMGEHAKMAKVYQCPMDKYTSEKPGECPLCGMKLEEKEMTADEAQTAIEESKSE